MALLKKLIYALALVIGFSAIGSTQGMESQFDKMLGGMFPASEPGAAALVAINGKIVYQKAFGMANLELDVKMEPDMVFEIGSITKQFTAVAVLMLMEQGKLSLDDDITKYIADYPTHGHHISIHHLLTHTSGIKSYTSMENWPPVWRLDYKPLELIDFFKNEPMDFEPGEAWLYNNSAYFILGYVIEKASGQPYGQFIEKNIFEPLGMKSSVYGSTSEIIKKRACGYQKNEGYINAEFLSLTQPYAAGSLMSTVGDLFIWNRAVRSNKLVKKESIDLAFTNYKLNNGNETNYGYGWGINEINGSPTLEHSGGIFGYVTNSIYLPDEDVFVALFLNCDCNDPGQVSTRMAAIAIGKPYPDQTSWISVEPDDLKKLVGVYDFADGSSRTVTLEGNQLYSQRTGSNKIKLFPTSKRTFSFENSLAGIEFRENGNEITASFTNRMNKTEGKKTDKPIAVLTEVQLDEEVLKNYTGVYEVTPDFEIAVTLENGKLMAQATGQPKFEIFPESRTKFFLKVVDARMEFIESDNGRFESFILHQGGQEITAKKKH